MKSGPEIYSRLLESADRMAAMRALGNGDIRSLVLHIGRQELMATDAGCLILGMAHIAVMDRFMAKKTQDCKTQDAREETREEARQEQEARDCSGAMGEGYLP